MYIFNSEHRPDSAAFSLSAPFSATEIPPISREKTFASVYPQAMDEVDVLREAGWYEDYIFAQLQTNGLFHSLLQESLAVFRSPGNLLSLVRRSHGCHPHLSSRADGTASCRAC